jgi:hypothetical protein
MSLILGPANKLGIALIATGRAVAGTKPNAENIQAPSPRLSRLPSSSSAKSTPAWSAECSEAERLNLSKPGALLLQRQTSRERGLWVGLVPCAAVVRSEREDQL